MGLEIFICCAFTCVISVIADFDTAELMLKLFISIVHGPAPVSPDWWHSQQCHRHRNGVLMDAALQAGAERLYLIDEPVAAIGTGDSPCQNRSWDY